ncbi:MAG: phosphotransferase [Desulfobacteraceae bacterium 4572_19]|nr:MAG: phosphotransferase [Desulfobacteraceae bacterium 4572_19]
MQELFLDNKKYCENTFSDRVGIYSHDYLKCCISIMEFDESGYAFSKKLYSKLIGASQLLEDFLDFHGAKNNSKWFFYRELAAATRLLSLAAYSQQHVLHRFPFYGIEDDSDFIKESNATLSFLKDSLSAVAPAIIKEAVKLGIFIPQKGYAQAFFPGVITEDTLKPDIDDVSKDQQKKNIVKIASEFLVIAKTFDEFRFFEPYAIDEIMAMVPKSVNEVKIRRFEMIVHNLQSAFDSYVIHGGYRIGNIKLNQLRGHFSVVFQLLQIMGRFLHYYERHIHEVGYKTIYVQVQKRLTELIDPEILLDRTINYGFFYACYFLSTGKKVAREILNDYIERSSIQVPIPMKMGFHSRPSLMVAKVVQHFGGQVELCVGNDKFDASSVLDIQWAGGKISKEKITEVVFKGDSRALNDLKLLADVNYGEDSIGKGVALPSKLDYLK